MVASAAVPRPSTPLTTAFVGLALLALSGGGSACSSTSGPVDQGSPTVGTFSCGDGELKCTVDKQVCVRFIAAGADTSVQCVESPRSLCADAQCECVQDNLGTFKKDCGANVVGCSRMAVNDAVQMTLTCEKP